MCQPSKYRKFIAWTRSIYYGDPMTDSEILAELKAIRDDVEYIKEHMLEIDTILTAEEERILKETLQEYRRGETMTLDDIEREIPSG